MAGRDRAVNLVIEHVPIHELRPHPRNPRNGDIPSIIESLRINEQYRPLVIAREGTVLCGNHTYMAALEMEWETLAVVRHDLDPYDERAIRIMLVDNRLSDLGNYDDGLLADLLAELEVESSLVGTGYRVSDLERLVTVIDRPLPPVEADVCPCCGKTR